MAPPVPHPDPLPRSPWRRRAPRIGGWSLATRILAGLLANVLLVVTVFAVALLVQVRLNPSWMLAGRAGDRLQLLAQSLSGDLASLNTNEFPALLRQYETTYRLPFLLLADEARPLAGTPSELPREVLLEAQRPRGQRLARSGRGPAGPGRGPAEGGRGPRWMLPPGPAGPEPFPRVVLRAGQPPAYWIVIHLPLPPRHPARTLVLRSESLWSGGLLLDARPWLLAGFATLVISGLFWLPFVRRIHRDIRRMTHQTATIAAGRFDSRLDLQRGDELGVLADAIDRMAAQLAQHVEGQRRFLGDAAHELCSPLARMQTAVAILESRGDLPSPSHLADLREELDEMSALVEELLAYARAAHGRRPTPEPVELRPLLEHAWARESRPHATLHLDVPDHAVVLADRTLLLRALANLLRNAVRYAAQAGPIEVSARPTPGHWIVSVADQGPGVPTSDLERIFEPFYRPESSRHRDFGGAGLGLAIVRTCIDAFGATVVARLREPQGLEIILDLPRPSPAAP